MLRRRGLIGEQSHDSNEAEPVEDVLELHELQLARYGGADGLRDRGGCSSRPWRSRR